MNLFIDLLLNKDSGKHNETLLAEAGKRSCFHWTNSETLISQLIIRYINVYSAGMYPFTLSAYVQEM